MTKQENELPRFEPIDHTADAGIKVYGKDLKELFSNAALGLFDMIANLEKVNPDMERKVAVEASDREALLVNWLNELNFLFFTKREIYKVFEIENLTDTALNATVRGEKIDYDRHEIYTEVKAITYHYLYIKKTARGWEAQIIFDI
ncbi:MAG: archease [Calditrichaeota bacterium]|nr:MAG: archease [Calditrichota bacterium]